MDNTEELFVPQCIFCMKDADECELIEMNSNSMLISSVNVEFSTIVYDVVNRKISDLQHNYICEDCNEVMIQFYVFKENAKNNEYLLCDKKKTDVIKEVELFLEECGQEDIQIMNRGKCLALFPESERKVMKDFQSWQLKAYVEHTNTVIPPPPQRKRKLQEINVDEDKDTPLSYENNDSMDSEDYEFVNIGVKSDPEYTDEHELNFEEYEDPETPNKESDEILLFQEPETKKLKIERKPSSDSDYPTPNKVIIKENVLIKKETRKKLITSNDVEQKNRFTCQTCNYSCLNIDTLKKHVKVIHMNDPNREKTIMKSKYSCDPCWLKFRDQINYDIHLKCHQLFEVIAPIVELPKCDECRCLFVNDIDLGTHLSRHHDPELLYEPILSEGTAMNARFVMEILMPEDEIEIDDDIAWKCGHCTRKFSDEVECRKHQLIFHARRFVCPIDNREFFRLPTHAFSQHLKKCHPELFPDIPIDCTYCHQVFTTIYDKLAHMKNCDEKKFICHCGNKFFKKAELLKHEKIHTGNTGYNCEICGKMAVNKQSLDTHMLSHTNETPYKCSLCPKAYKTSSARASHMEVHNETDLECSFCSVKFKKRAILQRHIKNYHDEKYREEKFREFTCSFCKKAFLKRDRYHHHMKNNHNVIIGEETVEEVTDYSE